MNDKQTDKLSISEIAKRHISGLIEQGNEEYRIFELVDTLDPNIFDIPNIRKDIFEVIDINETQCLKRNREIYSTAQGIFKLGHSHVTEAFHTFVKCLQAAESDRKTLRTVCSNFTSLICTRTPVIDKRFLTFVPELIKQHKKNAFRIVPTVLDNLSKINSDEQAIKYLDFIQNYLPALSEKGFKGLLLTSLFLFGSDGVHAADEFAKYCTIKALQHNEDAEKLIIRLGDAINNVPEELRSKYFTLCMMAASRSFGSAMFIVSDIPEKLECMENTARSQYLDSFARIFEHAGISTVGYCSGRLYKLFQKHPQNEVVELVNIICEIASKYGPTAAFAFIEAKKSSSVSSERSSRDVYVSIKLMVFIILVLALCVLLFKILHQ